MRNRKGMLGEPPSFYVLVSTSEEGRASQPEGTYHMPQGQGQAEVRSEWGSVSQVEQLSDRHKIKS